MNSKSQSVVVRMAPSPTGNLHIGTARTALFNFLFARKVGGKFIMRIEDTDKERSTPAFENNILEGFKWLGISYDEFFRQSEREEVYQKYLRVMIDNGTAYISQEEIKEEGDRPEVIRFKNPNKRITFDDVVRGSVSFDTTELGDFVIARSMEEPLYHLAVVIDDHEMRVTHIIRGEDHISNTPRQILIQEAIGALRPVYAHIPLILAPDRSKLSKRHGAVSMDEYREKGYLPQAIVNYLALLGWNPGTDQEIFSMEELINAFDLEKIQKGGAIFDEEKLKWINSEHKKKIPDEIKFEDFKKAIDNASINDSLKDKAKKSFVLFQVSGTQNSTLAEQKDWIEKNIAILETPTYSKDLLLWKGEKDFVTVARHIQGVMEIISTIHDDSWTQEAIKNSIWDYATEEGRGSVLWPMRVALSGREKSPDPFAISVILGKEETLSRLSSALALIS